MQYTSGSFAGIAAGWPGWALRGEGRVIRPRGYFPVNALRAVRVPELVLERVVAPVGGLVMDLSGCARRMQHGRLRYYILYLVAGVALLGLIAAVGGRR